VVNAHGEDELTMVRGLQQLLRTSVTLAAGPHSIGLAQQLGRYHEIDIDALRTRKATDRPVPQRPASSVAEILVTSGTTGPPKAVGVTQADLEVALRQTVEAPSDAFADQSAFVHHIMPGTQAAQRVLLQAMRSNKLTSIGVNSLGTEEFLATVRASAASFIGLVPLTARKLVRHCRHDGVLLPTVLWVSVGSAHVPPRLLDDLAHLCPSAVVMNMYGLTEAGVARIRSSHPGRPGALGTPEPGTSVEVRDDQGQPVPSGVPGDLWIHASSPSRCYVDDPEMTAHVFRDGWVRTGDVARVDKDGYVYVAGRRSELICLDGITVSPDEIEDCLLEHELVSEVSVYGVPTPSGHEHLVAAVVATNSDMPPSAVPEGIVQDSERARSGLDGRRPAANGHVGPRPCPGPSRRRVDAAGVGE
jgi:acyl-coenzyme A synthetase/AMP-(fatty) acid ligase